MAYGVGALEQAILDLAVAKLTACGRPVPIPSEVYRAHGEVVVHSCCGDGLMTTHWLRPRLDTTGIPAGMGNPPGRPLVDIVLRLYRCYPMMKSDGSFDDVERDAAAEGLANDLDCLFSAFTVAICDGTLNPYLSGCDQLALTSAAPRAPRGGCAGIELVFAAGWRSWSP